MLMTAGVYYYAFGQALRQLERRGQSDLALAADRLAGQMQRYQDLAVLLAEHPVLRGPDKAAARVLLRGAADKTSALNIVQVDRQGRVQAEARSDLAGPPGAPVARALQGALGTGNGLVSDGRRAYFFAAPEFGSQGHVAGAVIVAVDIDNVELDWPGSTPAVFFTDARGQVFISNRSEVLFWHREGGGLAPPGEVAPAFAISHRAGFEIWQLRWGPYLPASALHLMRAMPTIGMRAEALIDTAPARSLALWQAAVFGALWLMFGAFLWFATERRRVLAQANRQLEARVEARTAELKRAQADLVQAGKLAALGQMSAGISHELNQPLMAIRQFAENGAAFLKRARPEAAGENLERIAALAARAARIIRNLRAFARNESEPSGRVDLVQVVGTAVELTEARVRQAGVRLDWCAPDAPVPAQGGEVRLVQVFVNLINNAVDAMAGQGQEKRIAIDIVTGARLAVRVRDTGPGIADPERIFEPFFSTKEVGQEEEGMGLGLSISYGLVQSFGGNISGANAPDGGAIFSVELEHWREEAKAA
ncbi:ATP-binding protein [Aquicoccus sp. G2-2]|uniref:sensor histidine kinase n=1 Tax=Aquicoccus sp. G2-2 TaxID=3092120 RepID=UPI002AE069F8|nr:ATP-binding protein [Aquicoccus sp. G2-2]MEA1112946.1 ATP-binding protein [Aquicoccus sp. G2-2]